MDTGIGRANLPAARPTFGCLCHHPNFTNNLSYQAGLRDQSGTSIASLTKLSCARGIQSSKISQFRPPGAGQGRSALCPPAQAVPEGDGGSSRAARTRGKPSFGRPAQRRGGGIGRVSRTWPSAQVPATQADRVAAQLCTPKIVAQASCLCVSLSRTGETPVPLSGAGSHRNPVHDTGPVQEAR